MSGRQNDLGSNGTRSPRTPSSASRRTPAFVNTNVATIPTRSQNTPRTGDTPDHPISLISPTLPSAPGSRRRPPYTDFTTRSPPPGIGLRPTNRPANGANTIVSRTPDRQSPANRVHVGTITRGGLILTLSVHIFGYPSMEDGVLENGGPFQIGELWYDEPNLTDAELQRDLIDHHFPPQSNFNVRSQQPTFDLSPRYVSFTSVNDRIYAIAQRFWIEFGQWNRYDTDPE